MRLQDGKWLEAAATGSVVAYALFSASDRLPKIDRRANSAINDMTEGTSHYPAYENNHQQDQNHAKEVVKPESM